MAFELFGRHIRYFDLARRLSYKSDHHRHKLGCVLVNGNKIVGIGYNQSKTHTKCPNKYKQIHSEFHAILGVDPADLCGATIYVFRAHMDGSLAISKPCPTCAKMLQDCNVKEVIYTVENGYESYRNY